MIEITPKLKSEIQQFESCEERIDHLKDKYKGKTAVILLTGPTLNDHDHVRMREIFSERDDLVIMPVKQAYNATLETSDFHVMNHWNIDKKTPFDYKSKDTIQFWNCTLSFLQNHIDCIQDNGHPCDIWIPVVNYPYITREQSIQATCNFELFWDLGKEYKSWWGTSITYSTAIPLALHIGCRDIVIVAWDLKLTPESANHFYKDEKQDFKTVPIDVKEELEVIESTKKLYDWFKNLGIRLRVLSKVSPIDERIERLNSIEDI